MLRYLSKKCKKTVIKINIEINVEHKNSCNFSFHLGQGKRTIKINSKKKERKKERKEKKDEWGHLTLSPREEIKYFSSKSMVVAKEKWN